METRRQTMGRHPNPLEEVLGKTTQSPYAREVVSSYIATPSHVLQQKRAASCFQGNINVGGEPSYFFYRKTHSLGATAWLPKSETDVELVHELERQRMQAGEGGHLLFRFPLVCFLQLFWVTWRVLDKPFSFFLRKCHLSRYFFLSSESPLWFEAGLMRPSSAKALLSLSGCW